jgi:hypothetical protein
LTTIHDVFFWARFFTFSETSLGAIQEWTAGTIQ